MKRRDLWRLSLLNVFAAPVRSLLTVLGMAIGIGAILAVLTLGEAGKTQVRSEMARLGIDKVWLSASHGAFRPGDADLLEESLHVDATETACVPALVQLHKQSATLPLVGCSPRYLDMNGVRLTAGRALHPLEWRRDGRSILLGAQAAQELGASPGDVVMVLGTALRVAGLVEGGDAFVQMDPAQAVFLPVEALCGMIGEIIHEIMLDVPSGEKPQHIAQRAQSALGLRRGIAADAVTLQVQMEAADSVITTFVEVLKWVAFVCILVGGIGVMNILLVSVRERRREIGVMKSLGAGFGQICALFLLEALIYALIGGLLGVCIGLGLISMAGGSIGLNARAKPADCVIVLLCSLLVGLFFGVAPASRAAGMRCVDALRDGR
ncbi:MAG: ABC transporter permease [bacterium]|nr:ABC transporter permease [bacterium]